MGLQGRSSYHESKSSTRSGASADAAGGGTWLSTRGSSAGVPGRWRRRGGGDRLVEAGWWRLGGGGGRI
eukprot:scaffold36183_cov56-Phaeocystis_antarctica.AAC.8